MELRCACTFAPPGWSANEWIEVGSPRWAQRGIWVQEEEHLRNGVPAGATPDELLGLCAPETYTSQVWRERVSGALRVRAEMAFDHRMAPLIVLAPELSANCNSQPQYREHFEVVLYDEGINVWHHTFALGRPRWQKLAHYFLSVAPRQRHTLEVEKREAELIVRAAGREFVLSCPALPQACYVGITGSEGVNRFYAFSLRSEAIL